MPALFNVFRRPAEAVNQKIAQALLGSAQVVSRIHRAEDVVRGNLPVEFRRQAIESRLADGGVNLEIFH